LLKLLVEFFKHFFLINNANRFLSFHKKSLEFGVFSGLSFFSSKCQREKPVEVLIHDTHSYNAIFSQHNIFFDTHKTQKLQLGQVYRLTFVQNHFKGQDNAKAVQFFSC